MILVGSPKTNSPKPNGQPWRKIPCALKERLHELQGARLHVWLCHFLYANIHGEAWPSLQKIHDNTGFSERSILPARRSLVKDGWLQRVSKGQPRNGTRFASPHFRVLIPSVRQEVPDGKKQHFRTANTSGFRTAETSDRSRETEVKKREEETASQNNGKCTTCGGETYPGFVKCHSCVTRRPRVNP